MTLAEGGIAVRLIDVRAARINAIALGKDSEPPDWAVKAEGEDAGAIRLMTAQDDRLVVQLTAMLTGRLMAIEIGLQGLYEVDKDSPGLLPASEDTQSVLDRIPAEFRAELAALATDDLYPYLRHAFHTISTQIDPNSRIMLTPSDGWSVLTA
ncbi:hypothetical protein [Mycobacterium riyadhense]|uniref:Uncharacterized protein n=1 Tax=Mycobacterium riyadhense TaxID=486698 RepID=A0A653F2V2_9MYCO|nr:hypothetical protein [Mycobacterium riyadhense]VTP03950.1 hypothetical protein BIN_B_05324 [Mycobacterium riyadhense]